MLHYQNMRKSYLQDLKFTDKKYPQFFCNNHAYHDYLKLIENLYFLGPLDAWALRGRPSRLGLE
jgi:hypothetical protein